MKNSDLMQILKQINLSYRYKNLAIGLGVIALAGVSTCVYYHLKIKSCKQDLAKINEKHSFLLEESWVNKELIRQQQEQINMLLS